jgi:ABC-type Zn uptake system ZnuABC Zn-binding protein ZnuA
MGRARPRPRPGRTLLGGIALAAAVALGAAGCGGGDAPAPRAPTIEVVTGLYPLAQAIQQIGGTSVAVTDLVPPGSDPRTYRPTAAQIAELHNATVVVEVGGFQPAFDAAAQSARHVLDLGATLGTDDPYVWLDPDLMTRAVTAIASALEAANPLAAGAYRNGAEAFSASVASTGIDYESTLSVCPRRLIVTADSAFAGMAHQYGLTDEVIDSAVPPGSTQIAADVARIKTAGLSTVFSEPFVPTGAVQAVAAAAHVKVRVLDTLTGPPPPPAGWPRHVDYIQLMEANLSTLNSALGCPDTSTGM